jgi:hypothetical protein
MSCQICGRNNCTRSFHSIEEQDLFDLYNKTDEIKEKLKRVIEKGVDKIKGEWINDEYYVKLSDVNDVIENSD